MLTPNMHPHAPVDDCLISVNEEAALWCSDEGLLKAEQEESQCQAVLVFLESQFVLQTHITFFSSANF